MSVYNLKKTTTSLWYRKFWGVGPMVWGLWAGIPKSRYQDLSAIELFYVSRYEGLVILGISGFYTILKPKLNLKHTLNDSLCLKPILYQIIDMLKSENRPIRIEKLKSG